MRRRLSGSWAAPAGLHQLLNRAGRARRPGLSLFASGHTHRQIADPSGVRLKTVETYRSRLGDKFGVRSRGELIVCARELGLVAPR